jgi:hypothetical protein
LGQARRLPILNLIKDGLLLEGILRTPAFHYLDDFCAG